MIRRQLRRICWLIGVLFFLFGIAAFLIYLRIPSDSEIKGCLVTKMYQVRLCPGEKSYVPLKQISPYLIKATVLTEDSSFYQHNGFDWNSIEKNARDLWEKRRIKRGGSTITQQLAKNMFLTKDRTFVRKGLEALITYRIEAVLTKNEILERYLNVIEFGKDLYGVKAAASFYFDKKPSQLNVPESAFLVLILPSPIKYSRSFFAKELSTFAKSRISRIIRDLYRYHRITEAEYDEAVIDYEFFFGPAPMSDVAPSDDQSSAEDEELDLEN